MTPIVNRTWDRQAALESVGTRLWQYLAASAATEEITVVVENLWQLRPGDLRRLSAVHLAMSELTDRMIQAAAAVLRALPSSTESSVAELVGKVRGGVLWDRTRRRRWATGDPMQFVVRLPERRYDTALGRLVKRALQECATLVGLSAFAEEGDVAERVRDVSMRSIALLNHAKLREVRSVRTLSHPMLELLGRRRSVGPIVQFIRAYREAVTEFDERTVRDVISERLLAPSADDRLFELMVAFKVVDGLVSMGYRVERLTLVPGASLPFALLSRGERVARVWWQRSLWELAAARGSYSFFHQVLDSAGLRRSSLRPDLIIEHSQPMGLLMVEVKQTGGTGINADRSGIIEALAYLHDAQSVTTVRTRPYTLVVGWNSAGRPAVEAVMVSDQNHVEDSVRLAIRAWESGP